MNQHASLVSQFLGAELSDSCWALAPVSACTVHPVAEQLTALCFQLLCSGTVNHGARGTTEMHAPSFNENPDICITPCRVHGKDPLC